MIFNIKSKDEPALEKKYEEAMNSLEEFFGLNWKNNRPKLFIVDDMKTREAINPGKHSWSIGWVDGPGKLFLLKRSLIGKETNHQKYSPSQYGLLMKHELCHCFFLVLSKGKYEPDWLWEGTSMYLSGELKKKNKPKQFTNFLRYYKKEGQEVYNESGHAIQFLVEKHGKEKLINLIRSLSTISSEMDFSKKFEEIYGFKLAYENFV